MRPGHFLALLILLLYSFSCTQSSLVQWPQQDAHEISSPTETEPVTGAEGNSLVSAPAPEVNAADNGQTSEVAAIGKDEDEAESEGGLYTDQKRIDGALYFYQEALECWHKAEFDKAIESLDQSYQIICSVQSENDPEITQQKEDLRLLISKRVLEIYASRPHPQLSRSREIPLAMNQYVER
jgi:membrane-bound lytic murein transglycosylase D